MSRRMDIELTSRRDDGSWTWRAPGARQPRGSVDGTLLPAEAAVGDVLRVEADVQLDGIFVTAVQPPKETTGDDGGGGRIEILGSGHDVGGVSVTVVARARWHREDEEEARPASRSRRDDRRRPPGAKRGDEDVGASPEGGRARPGLRRERPRRGRPDATKDRTEVPRQPAHATGRPERPEPARAARAQRPRDETAPRPDRRRLEQVTTHRNAALAALRPEQLPVAEQLLRGGMPAVRRAIEEQNTRARAEDRAEISPDPLLMMAEELRPTITLATWKDRGVAARNAGKDTPLRELRSVVAGSSSVTLDDEARTLLTTLRESLEARVTALRESWLRRIKTALDDDRVADALRISSRPSEPSARVPGELAVHLAAAAGAAMSPELPEDRWAQLLEAVVESPVRRTVKPTGLPREPSEDLLRAARHAAGAVPELARLLGLPIPPPPGPRRRAVAANRRS
ncbi:MAG: hypothetical protein ABSB99_04375 [Acidimicrobiales bacterium]